MSYVLNRPHYNRRFLQRSRMRSMLRRHGKFCAYCEVELTRDGGYNGPSAPSRDHIIPLSRGGSDSLENLAISCRECNEIKGSLDAEEFMAWREGRASRLDWIKRPRRHRPYWVQDPITKEWKPNPLNEAVRPVRKLETDDGDDDEVSRL